MTTNHPAHGPVSLDLLHQIRETLSKAAVQSDGGNLGYAMADAVKVIDGAIASFDAEPVGYFYADKPGDWYQISDGDRVPSHRRIPLYASPQSSPAVKLPNEFVSSEGIVVQIEKLMAVLAVHGIQYERRGNACRAAMLQGTEPVSNSDGLPLDYLQGHKDGLEWAAQLAEANHPQTGDWLYDDPIELAGAIRKGPDMPPVQTASVVDADDNFYSWFGREWEKYYQPNNYSLSAKKHLGAIAESAWFACRSAMLQAGNHTEQHLDMVGRSGDANQKVDFRLPFAQWLSQQNEPIDVDCGCVTTEAFYHWLRVAYEAGSSPVTPEGWIPVSERMPPNKPGSYEYIVFDSLNNKSHHDYWNVPDGSCDDFSPFWNHYGKYVTHWMPLPAAPQQEVK